MLAFTERAEQGFRACLGIMKLAKSHGTERLEAACERALEINARTYSSVKSILQNNLERKRRERAPPSRQHAFACACRVIDGPAITHTNIRRTRGAPIPSTGPPPAGRAGYFH